MQSLISQSPERSAGEVRDLLQCLFCQNEICFAVLVRWFPQPNNRHLNLSLPLRGPFRINYQLRETLILWSRGLPAVWNS